MYVVRVKRLSRSSLEENVMSALIQNKNRCNIFLHQGIKMSDLFIYKYTDIGWLAGIFRMGKMCFKWLWPLIWFGWHIDCFAYFWKWAMQLTCFSILTHLLPFLPFLSFQSWWHINCYFYFSFICSLSWMENEVEAVCLLYLKEQNYISLTSDWL